MIISLYTLVIKQNSWHIFLCVFVSLRFTPPLSMSQARSFFLCLSFFQLSLPFLSPIHILSLPTLLSFTSSSLGSLQLACKKTWCFSHYKCMSYYYYHVFTIFITLYITYTCTIACLQKIFSGPFFLQTSTCKAWSDQCGWLHWNLNVPRYDSLSGHWSEVVWPSFHHDDHRQQNQKIRSGCAKYFNIHVYLNITHNKHFFLWDNMGNIITGERVTFNVPFVHVVRNSIFLSSRPLSFPQHHTYTHINPIHYTVVIHLQTP